MRWVGIDEAGYGPNLGPLVMTAVVAESRASAQPEDAGAWRGCPDLWRDLAPFVDRAGGDPSRLWVDDSKRILAGGKGRTRLETTCLALLQAVGQTESLTAESVVAALGAGDPRETELANWGSDEDPVARWPSPEVIEQSRQAAQLGALDPSRAGWTITAVRSVVLGPRRFNERLDLLHSKAAVHFSVFRELLKYAWDLAASGKPVVVHGDKHGGRHYYLELLTGAFPDVWIERGVEGPALSQYRLRASGRVLDLELVPGADGSNGLVALASIVSKTVREVWMDRFNAFWTRRVKGLRPTAGYPADAARFRAAIEPLAKESERPLILWWRRK